MRSFLGLSLRITAENYLQLILSPKVTTTNCVVINILWHNTFSSRMKMNYLSSARSLDYSVIQSVFRRCDTIDSQNSLAGCYSQDHEPSPSLDEQQSTFFFTNELSEIGGNKSSDISISRNIFLVPSELNGNERQYLVNDARDPDDNCREANEDGIRTDPQKVSCDLLSIARRSSSEDELGNFEFLRNNESPLKRANPIFESDSEAEHVVEVHKHHAKRRRSMVLGGGSPSSTHLFWPDLFPSE
jgi:hypothetical protein